MHHDSIYSVLWTIHSFDYFINYNNMLFTRWKTVAPILNCC